MTHAAAAGKITAINLGATFLCQFYKDQQMQVFPHVEYVFGNESEAQVFAETHNLGTNDCVEIAKKMADPALFPLSREGAVRKVVITQGADPTIVAVGTEKVLTIKPKALAKEKIVDVNGAGDAFVGGFLSQLVGDASLEQCVLAGHYCARIIIQTSGCVLPQKRPNFVFKAPTQA